MSDNKFILLQKKKQIDEVFKKYVEQMKNIMKKRDEIVFSFLRFLRDKKLEELRNILKKI
jgi:mevalonate kinase